jgi:2-phosphosulfolactate phosphatase
MARTVVIDWLPDCVHRYRDRVIVAVDVIRATTTAVTAIAQGRRCFPVASEDEAHALSAQLHSALLAGESGGDLPDGFELGNSPALVAARTDTERPLVLLSTSGTKLVVGAHGASRVYVACLRNVAAQVEALAAGDDDVALIGAGSLGAPRVEDELCCAWIAAALIDRGFSPADGRTDDLASRWRGAPPDAIAGGPSADFLRRTGQEADLEFVLSHVDDLDRAFVFDGREVLAA